MLIVLNGYPGVGKLTIGRVLADLIGARLLDNHSIYNPAFALTDFKSDAFFDTVRAVQNVADARIAELPEGQPLVLTEVLTEGSDWAEENWNRILHLAKGRGGLVVVHLSCDLDEHKRRIADPERASKRKPIDPEYAARNQEQARPLMRRGADRFLALDVTELAGDVAARTIRDWLYDGRP